MKDRKGADEFCIQLRITVIAKDRIDGVTKLSIRKALTTIIFSIFTSVDKKEMHARQLLGLIPMRSTSRAPFARRPVQQ